MAHHAHDMSQVPDPNEAVPEGWYHCRIAKVEEGESKSNNPVVNLQLKIQNEGAATGRIIFDTCSLQPQALFKLKAYYSAVGYKPTPDQGHDPDNLIDGEVWVFAEHKVYEGQTRIDIKPYAIKSLTEGPRKKAVA